MRKPKKRTVVLLLLILGGLALGVFGQATVSTTNHFLEKENTFREGRSAVTSGKGWVEEEPNLLQVAAQNTLAIRELLDIREALEAYRITQRQVSSYDYGGAQNRAHDRELAKSKLTRLIRSTKDPVVIIQAATLLGDLFAQDTITYVEGKKEDEAKEAYSRAVDAFTTAILADPTDTINGEPKEHLEILIRMFLTELSPGGEEPGPPTNGPRGGTSDPGSGY